MSELTRDELEEIAFAISQEPLSKEMLSKVPMRPARTYGKVAFSPLEGEKPRPLNDLTPKELGSLGEMKAHIEVVYGKTKISLKKLAALKEGHLLPLDQLCDELVDIYANGELIGRGEVVAVNGQFGVKIVTLKS